MICHGLHADLAQDAQAVPGKMMLPSVLDPRACPFPESQPAGLQCVAEQAFVCRHHWGDIVKHGDGLNDLLRGLKWLMLQVTLVELCREV